LLCLRGERRFLTSDNPVIFYNQYFQSVEGHIQRGPLRPGATDIRPPIPADHGGSL
jgi:hypothetical protein